MKLARGESARLTYIQEKQVELGIAELKMKALEVQISYIQMKALTWVEHARAKQTGPELLKVKEEMEKLIADLQTEKKI